MEIFVLVSDLPPLILCWWVFALTLCWFSPTRCDLQVTQMYPKSHQIKFYQQNSSLPVSYFGYFLGLLCQSRGNISCTPRKMFDGRATQEKHWLHGSGLCLFPTDIALPWNGFTGGEEQTYVTAISLAALHRWPNPSSYGIHCRQTSCETAQCQPKPHMNR